MQKAQKNFGSSLIDYKVTPSYTGADAGLKTALLNAYDDTNDALRSDTRPNLITWLDNYIDTTFPQALNVDVTFMQSNGKQARAKPNLIGQVTNEPS